MAVYFKCPNCGHYVTDFFGEFANGEEWDTSDYGCPICQSILQVVELEELLSAPHELHVTYKNIPEILNK